MRRHILRFKRFTTIKKMLESRPEDALVKLVKHAKLVKLVIKLLFLDFSVFFLSKFVGFLGDCLDILLSTG